MDKKALTAKYYDGDELTAEERKVISVGSIRSNKAKCLECGDVLQSRHRHDFRTCACGNLSVDGGSWYARRGFIKDDSYKELSVYYKK